MIKKILFWLIDRTYKSRFKNLLKAKVSDMYKQDVRDSFKAHSEAVRVKKGKTKYTLIFIQTSAGNTYVNIGRHTENNLPTSQILK